MNKKEKKLAERIRSAIDDIWYDYYEEEGIDNGDIAPFDVLWYEDSVDEIAKLIYRIGESNKGDE